MSYQNGYEYGGQYAGYRGSDSGQQTQQQYLLNQDQYHHPMVLIPSQQPRHDVSNFQTPSHRPYSQQQPISQPPPGFYQQSPSQYQTPPQQQGQQSYYPQSQPQPQQYYASQGYVQQRSQGQYYQPQHNYAQPPRPSPTQSQAQPPYQRPYQQQSRQPSQASPLLPPQPIQSPDPLQGPSNLNRAQVQPSQQHRPAQVQPPRPQRWSSQQTRTPSSPIPSHPQPTPRQRVVAAVEIPSYTHAQPVDHDMGRSPKRRRSNDGRAVPVCDVYPQSKRSSQQKPSQIASSPLTELNSSQMPSTPQPSVDYQTVLLTLAEEYISAAHSMSASLATGNAPHEQHEEYCSLISTAMACLESVLNNFRQTDARKEARIRLRLATLLVDECDNDEEAEAILGKGIALCERNRLTDLKYAMQHLAVRLAFSRSPKAALKSVDKLVQEAEALRLTHWVYTFRFLRVSLGLQLGTHSELSSIAKHLAALHATAEEDGRVAVQVVAAALEIVVHLRSPSPDAVDMASRAMAAAQTHQLGPEMQAMPQIRGLLDCLDAACSLLSFNPDLAFAKTQRIETNLDSKTRDLAWRKDGSFEVELGPSSNENLEQDTGGIMRRSKFGNAMLIFQWITKTQLYALAYALSGFSMMQKTMARTPGAGDKKADEFLSDGLKMASIKPDVHRSPLSTVTALLNQQQELSTVMRVYLIFARCGRFEWGSAQTAIASLRQDPHLVSGSNTAKLLLYLEASCRHGLGDLQAALALYDSDELIFDPDAKANAADKDLRVMATLNSIFIRRSLGPEEYMKAERLLATVEPYCLNHSNRAIYSAINLAKATAQDTILKTKQFLHLAVQASKEASNNLLMSVVMNIMTSRFFSQAIVGDQAEKSAHAARTLAKQGKNKLWTCVADGMFGDIKERCGKLEEAEIARREGRGMFGELPEGVREGLRR
ncbi:uncharacterized protein LTR77_010533 [Saxophila tyrrhenica]|uniref:75k gamma secalin n=1 Tax=Saxophila tyrrhenica TaxID=1690608 RepID=A0AAV9NYN5_9PEZI|nr:hypothetical protein LTR77_010533 [Saxophila tyrrhenica]